MSAARRRGATAADLRERRAAVDDLAVVLDAAAAFLAVRPRSVGETRQRLRRLGYRADLVEAALNQLAGLGYLDDAAFGHAWVESRDRARPRSARALRAELVGKGLGRGLVDELLEEREAVEPGADIEAARRLLARHAAALGRVVDPRVRRQRAYALLARHGFDPATCREALGPSPEGGEAADGPLV